MKSILKKLYSKKTIKNVIKIPRTLRADIKYINKDIELLA